MTDLPTPIQMLTFADRDLNRAYAWLSSAAEWLRSDWPPGSTMTEEQAEQRTRMFRAIADAKGAINAGRSGR